MASSDDAALLLDVNALMALAWPNHQFHRAVIRRLERRPPPHWATCGLTQLGFVRLSSNPAVVEVRKTPAEALGLLAELVFDERHVYAGVTAGPRDRKRAHGETARGCTPCHGAHG